MTFVGKCEKLGYLRISENPSLGDACLMHLNGLKSLTWLEMTQVPVTMKGLLSLRPIASNLHTLHLPASLAVNQKELTKLFPNCKIEFTKRSKSVDPLTNTVCAPLR